MFGICLLNILSILVLHILDILKTCWHRETISEAVKKWLFIYLIFIFLNVSTNHQL